MIAENASRMMVASLGIPIAEIDGCVLYHYQPDNQHSTSKGGKKMLLIPPMINKPYIMATGENNLLTALASGGIDVFVLAWHEPTLEHSSTWGINQYLGVVDKAVKYILHQSDVTESLALLGYCMGGVMAAMYASRNQNVLSQLICVATPWDFSVSGLPRLPNHIMMPLFAECEFIPEQFWQTAFYLRKFYDCNHKYLKSFTAPTLYFLQLESWLSDGINMSKCLFEEFNHSIVFENQLVHGNVRVQDHVYEISKINIPCLIIAGEHDQLIPKECALAAHATIGRSQVAVLKAGHVELVAEKGTSTAEAIARWMEQSPP
jgi:polyhydroxyalkanoate synthase